MLRSLPSPARRTALAPLALVWALAACGGGNGAGGGGGPTGSNPVTQVTLAAPGSTLEAGGGTLQVTATPRDADGRPVSGASVTWSSSADAVARVDASGLVTGVAPGAATIRAEAAGIAGTLSLTVVPAAVASVTVSPDAWQLQLTDTTRLSATARDARGNVLAGRAVAWTSLDPGVASVGGGGEVRGLAVGTARVVAAVEGKADTAAVIVLVPVAVRVQVSPRFAVAGLGESMALRADAFAAGAVRILTPDVAWTSSAGALAVSASGAAVGSAPGVYRAAARVNQASDTATVAVLGPASILATAFAGDSIAADARAGDTVSVPLVLNLSRVSANGDLGAMQMELRFDPAVLSFEAHAAVARGALDVFSPGAGTVRVAFAETAPQGSGVVTLARLRFRVAAGAPTGTRAAFTLLFTALPASTGFTRYTAPLTVGGSVRVVP